MREKVVKAMRRVVIAHDDEGRSIVASDSAIVPEEMPGVGQLYRGWSVNQPAHYPDAGEHPNAPGLFPPVAGVRYHLCTFGPGQSVQGDGKGDDDVQWEEGGLHRTDTTDINIVLDGEMVLAIDGGTEITLARGDSVVIAGARHAWRNEGTLPATVAFFMVGARRNDGHDQ